MNKRDWNHSREPSRSRCWACFFLQSFKTKITTMTSPLTPCQPSPAAQEPPSALLLHCASVSLATRVLRLSRTCWLIRSLNWGFQKGNTDAEKLISTTASISGDYLEKWLQFALLGWLQRHLVLTHIALVGWCVLGFFFSLHGINVSISLGIFISKQKQIVLCILIYHDNWFSPK